MDHVAIDLGARKSQICVRSGDGAIVEEKRCDTAGLKKYLAERKQKCRVVVETCAEAFGVADAALALGHEARVVPATLVRTLGVGARRNKTDRRDAQVLSEVSCRIDLPSVHIPSARARERKTVCGMREGLVGARTKLINTVRGWLRGQGRRPRTGSASTFSERVRELYGETMPSYVERQLRAVEALTKEIKEADEAVEQEAEADETCRRLMTVPGVAGVTAMRFVAAVDQVERFESAHQLESYLGLVPGESSSSERQQRLSITKAGPTKLRWVLVQAAHAVRTRCRAPAALPLQLWAHQVELRRGKRTATVALARKLAGILYAIWRDGSVYHGARAAKPTT
jgi:transposase